MRKNIAIVVLTAVFCLSCGTQAIQSIDREDLFKLSIGRMEDQLDLFRMEGRSRPGKTRITMRDGIVYLADGNGAKLTSFTSYGDLLSMIYNSDTNPPPLTLKTDFTATDVVTRRAVAYPLNAIGEVVVNSKKEIYLEDRLPPERRAYDAEKRTMFDQVVLKFDNEGKFIEYLGQEGVGGTPFPVIIGIHISQYDELVVICRTTSGWNVYWFDDEGKLLYLVLIERDDLPLPPQRKSLPSLERIVPALDDRKLYLNIDYYKETVDEQTKTDSGIGYDGSLLWTMDVKTGSYVASMAVPVLEVKDKTGDSKTTSRHLYSFLGATYGGRFFFFTPDTGGYSLLVLVQGSPDQKRGFIRVADEELVLNDFCLSDKGILSALLANEYDAKVVWWRTDKLAGEGHK